MRLKQAQQLLPSLGKELKPLVWIAGDEPLLLQESADAVRRFCRDNGYEDREVFTVDRSFNWSTFSETTDSLSLFAEHRLIELRLASPKLDDRARKALLGYLESPNPDYLILITSPRVEPGTLNTRWFKTAESHAWFLPIWPLSLDELPDWLSQRLLKAGLRPSPEALQLLMQRVEGNLLAAVQEIEKLRLLAMPSPAAEAGAGSATDKDRNSPAQASDGVKAALSEGVTELDTDMVMQAVADSSRYSTFSLIDTALTGDARRSLKILTGLRNEGVEPLAILGATCAELRRLLPAARQVQDGQMAARMADQLAGRNFRRKAALTRALQRLRPTHLYRLLDQARLVDYCVKGLHDSEPWLELENLFLGLCGTDIPALVRTA